MIAAIGSALTSMITWLGSVVSSVVGSEGALNDLLPVFALFVAATIVMFAIKIIRSFTWGA